MVNQYHLKVEDKIISLLRDNPSTINLLADKIPQTTYHTVRKVIYDMQKRNLVVFSGFANRSQVFALNPAKDDMSTIPYLQDLRKGNDNKAYALIRIIGTEDSMQSIEALKGLPRLTARLMYKALTYKNSKTKVPVDPDLGKIRQEMQDNYAMLQNMANMYRQILEHPKFWNESTLRDMAYDRDFDEQEVRSAYNFIVAEGADAPVFQSPL